MNIEPDWAAPVVIEQNTEKWLEWRRGGIGSSDAAVIMGVSPWKTALELYEELTGEKVDKTFEHYGMTRGKELEPVARAQYEMETGLKMKPALCEHPSHPFIRASLDGRNLEEGIILEIKCPGKEDHDEAKSGAVPTKYIPQLQHQLFVTQAKECHYYSFDGVSGVLLKVLPDLDYQEKLFEKEKEFWERVAKKIPPEPSERDYVEETDYVNLENLAEWKKKQAQIDLLESDCEELKLHILSRLKHPRVRGAGVRVQKISRKGNIDYSKIPELKSADLEPYRKSGSCFFTMSVEKEKIHD